eukprot:768746-Hanusia_phi.AAC.11
MYPVCNRLTASESAIPPAAGCTDDQVYLQPTMIRPGVCCDHRRCLVGSDTPVDPGAAGLSR